MSRDEVVADQGHDQRSQRTQPDGPEGQAVHVPPEAPMRWDGWGDPALTKELPFALRALIPVRLGRTAKRPPSFAIESVHTEQSALTSEDVSAFAEVVPAERVLLDVPSRLRHAGGKSTPDLLHRRRSTQTAPDAVITVESHDEVLGILRVAASRKIAVIPFGGGTNVVGAIEAERGNHRAVVVVTLQRLSGLLDLDEVSGQAKFLAGTTGPEAEKQLNARGFELGHFPQSFLYATLGGFAAARSSGQNSAGNGRFDSMVLGMRVATPAGELQLGVAPASSAGPDLMQLFLGSEGIFGVITELTLSVHRLPEARICDSWMFADFEAGAAAMRQLAQAGCKPTVMRLSDQAETSLSLAQHGSIGKALGKGCSAIAVFEGDREAIEFQHQFASRIIAKTGAECTGPSSAEQWIRGRFNAPYLRDSLLDYGVFCETLETATNWSNLERLKNEVTETIESEFAAHGSKCLVLCHVSHFYETGAALYFTIAASVRDDSLGVWHQVKAAITETIVVAEGTISHHHGVGRDHAPWLEREIGELGIEILRTIKAQLDPVGIMNPGALIAAEAGDGD